MALVRRGEIERGLGAFRQTLRLDPRHPGAHWHLAAALEGCGRSDEAVAHYQTFLLVATEAHPVRGEARRRLAQILPDAKSAESQAPAGTTWVPLGQMLINDGILSQEQLEEALARQRKNGERIGRILIEMQIIDEEVLLEYLARQFRKTPIKEEELANLDLDVVKLVPEDVARQYRIIAVERHGRKLTIATADPLNVVALDDLRRATGLDVDFRIGGAAAIQKAIDETYRRMIATRDVDEALRQDLGLSVEEMVSLDESVDIQQLRTQAADPPVVKIVNYVLNRAAVDGASDVHVEAYEDRTRVRYRIDGLLFDLLDVPRALHLAVVSRLKIVSRLDIAERRLPQDGSFAAHLAGREIDFRVSTMPTMYGEKVVLRLLEKDAVVQRYTLESLGFDPDQLAIFMRAIRRPWGMVLLTGPTGTGKSTTLHTAIKSIKSPRKNIVTVEDPVEYRQPGIQQVQVKSEIGFDFARSLRSILRQDPDIIMVGEIRDAETAQIAVRAALTGHLVLSTLHTNDAVSTLVRLINIGVEPFLVATAVNVVAAQRLVKKICAECKESYRPSPEELAIFGAGPAPETLYRGRGCPACRNIGYSGRMALYEVFSVGAQVRRMIIDGVDADQIRRRALEDGMTTLLATGLRHVALGDTTLEEILSVVAEAD
ncbi:MAG TPA: ATPase, T2SS/T4P/T4SS family [Candidatus Methylomirabilis sp.]|nr:ATPase, T2SS/T4P/T4SS family [Candidatus Methylomirabilis sp.]